MTTKKNTKRALLTSVMATVLCAAMLIGATFAWFTDSVASGKNKIVAGNLDIDLEYSTDGANWNEVDADTNLFKPTEGVALWEPGHTEYVYLRVSNAGSLALKYQLAVNVFGDENGGAEKEYTNKEGGKFQLSDYLVFSQTDGAASVTKREDLWIKDAAAEKKAMGKLDGVGMTDILLSGENNVLTLAVYMPTQVGNEANQLTFAKETEGEPTVYLGLTLNATQTPEEEDSFGKTYDEGAWSDFEKQQHLEDLLEEGYVPVESNSAFTEATKTEEKIVVTNDLDVDQNTPSIQGSTTIDFNYGQVTRATASGNGLLVQNYAADITLQNANFVSVKGGVVVRVEGANHLTVKNSNFICEADGSTGNKIFQLTPSEADKKMTVTFENCVFDTGYVAFEGYNNITEYDVRFINCKFLWDDKNGSSFVQAGSYAKGSYSFEGCTFAYTNWWSGPLVRVNNPNAQSSVTLQDITVNGSGSKKPYVVSGFSVVGKRNLTVTSTGTNQYSYNDSILDWETVAAEK